MRVENDNISTAISPDGRTVIMVDDLDRNQVEAILLYLFGMVDAVQTVTNHMVMSLAQGTCPPIKWPHWRAGEALSTRSLSFPATKCRGFRPSRQRKHAGAARFR